MTHVSQSESQARFRASVPLVVLAFITSAQAQAVFGEGPVTVTVEAYGNVTVGAATEPVAFGGDSPDAVTFDGAGRALARLHTETGPDIGARVVVEGSNATARIGEASLLLFGSAGRLEIGRRMGLPDVLSGYAPNAFTFTSAQFGPPTGRSLDPGGGLQTQFMTRALRSRIEPLASQGVTASQFNDESTKVLYVSPKHRGWLAGASFAPDPDDSRFRDLAQAGLVRERYFRQNVWRWGGSYAHARAKPTTDGTSVRDLNSFSIGTSVVVDDSLELGLAGSYDGTSGLPRDARSSAVSATWGATTSANFNTGPWTVGGYYQSASAENAMLGAGTGRLSAFELGGSYRLTTRLKLYAAWYRYALTATALAPGVDSADGSVVTLGVRATL